MRIAAHQPQYLAWTGYYNKMASCDLFVYLDDVQYKKREFQNRNKIRVKDGFIWLTVPVVTKNRYYQKINEVEIDSSRAWRPEHFMGIRNNYARAPHFGRYVEFFEKLYNTDWRFLCELNVSADRFIAAEFGIETPTRFSSEFGVDTSSTQRIVDICRRLGADEYLSGAGGRGYLDETLFAAAGIKLIYQEFRHPEYKQVFDGFEPCMSAIDILFNAGPAAAGLIKK